MHLRICSALRRAKLDDMDGTAENPTVIPCGYHCNYHAFTFHILGFSALPVISATAFLMPWATEVILILAADKAVDRLDADTYLLSEISDNKIYPNQNIIPT